MAVQFPNNPSVGDTVTDGGQTWEWDGTKWVNITPAAELPGQISIDEDGPEPTITLDSDGRLLVGTDTAPTRSAAANAKIVTQGNVNNAAEAGLVAIGRGELSDTMSIDDQVGSLLFTDQRGFDFATINVFADAAPSPGRSPGRMVFSTTPDLSVNPVERMTISSTGAITMTAPGSTKTLDAVTAGSQPAVEFRNTYTGDAAEVAWLTTSGTAASRILKCTGTGTFQVLATGDVQNTSGNQISPIGSERRIKQNIASFDPAEAWSVVKNVTPRTYELKETPGTPCYGYIVDELPKEFILPGTTEDEEGPIRTYDANKLAFMYRVALKEALTRIESLEQRLSALEGGTN